MSVPTPGGPSRYRTTRSTPDVLPVALRSTAQPHRVTVPDTVAFAAGPSDHPVGAVGLGRGGVAVPVAVGDGVGVAVGGGVVGDGVAAAVTANVAAGLTVV